MVSVNVVVQVDESSKTLWLEKGPMVCLIFSKFQNDSELSQVINFCDS